MTHSDQKHSFLLHRVFQYVTVIGILAILSGGYWYWKNARAAAEMDDNRPSFEAPLTHDLNLTRGQGVATYSRADGADRRATVTDFEGLIRPVKSGEARFEGARRVENLLASSESFENAPWTSGSVSANVTTAPDGTNTADQVTITAVQSNRRQAITRTVNAGDKYVFSVWLKASTTSNVAIEIDRDGGTTFEGGMAVLALTDTWKRYSYTYTFSAAHTGLRAMLVRRTDDPTVIYAWGAQLEEVTGQSNQNPSEYVSVGVKTSAPYHGAGVDGVKYFDTQNGNTVASNVVTEATGTAIATATLKGYLSEGARTNSTTNSEAITSWTQTDSTVIADSITAPDGRATADLVTQGTTGTANVNSATSSWTAGTIGTVSVYLRRGNNDWLRVTINGGSNQINAWFNIASGTTGSTSASGTGTASGSTIQSIGNGWYRCAISGSFSSTQAAGIFLSATNSDNSTTRADNATYYAWGGQAELSASFTSSYIPTVAASVTRAGDNLKYIGAGNFNDATGTVTVDVTTKWSGGNGFSAFFTDDSSTNQRMSLWHWDGLTNHLAVDRNGGGGTRNNFDYLSSTIVADTLMKLGQRWTGTAHSLFRDGSLRGSDTTLTLPYDTISGISIGQRSGSNSNAYATVKNVRAWKKALSDTELNGLTSLTQSTSDSAVKETTVKTPDNTGLVAYWSFEDGSGTKAEDFSAIGTNIGTLTNMEAGDWVDGKFSKALVFDGVNEYVNVPNTTSLNPGTGNFTISAWIRVDSTPTDYRRLINKGAGTNYYAFVKFPSDKWKFEFRDGTLSTGDLDFGSSTMTYGSWTHLVATVDQGNSLTSGYLDGVLKDTSSIAGYATVSNTDYLSLGRSSIDAPYAIDDVRIYDRALSSTEIADLYRSGSATKINASQNDRLTDGLVGLWSFNGPDISGTTAYDRSGNANDGTLTNGPVPTIGKVGQALSFDGSNDNVTIPTSASLGADFFRSSDWTISMWVNPLLTGNAGQELFMGVWHKPRLYINTGGGVIFSGFVSGAYTGFINNAGFFSANTWTHLTIVSNGTNYLLYKNGAQIASATYQQIDSGASQFRLGIDGSGASSAFNGRIDETRIYDRALTAAEVSVLYSLGR